MGCGNTPQFDLPPLVKTFVLLLRLGVSLAARYCPVVDC